VNDRSRPKAAPETPTKKSNTEFSRHPAEIAADATSLLHAHLWDRAIRAEIATGREVSADALLVQHGLPSGPFVGGVFMRLHREGVLRRVGYKPSRKPSSRGSVIAVWAAGEKA
jgi:hypothetical protein